MLRTPKRRHVEAAVERDMLVSPSPQSPSPPIPYLPVPTDSSTFLGRRK
uniref:Uncharacterized protein n=1 Tax=Setaria italica TaxID=4555 RepID=K3ZFT7_SETIT